MEAHASALDISYADRCRSEGLIYGMARMFSVLLPKTLGPSFTTPAQPDGFRPIISARLYFNSMKKGGTHHVVCKLDSVFGCSMFPRCG